MRFAFAAILTFLSYHYLLSQPEYHYPCAQTDTFHSLCQFACTLCDIDGFSKWTEANVWEGADGVTIPVAECGPSGGGGRDIFSFVAMSSELTLRVTVPECIHEDGPQAIERDFSVEGFYSDNNRCFDGNNLSLSYNFVSIFSCRDEDFIIQAGQSKLFTSTVPLIVGEVYYLQLGTSGATECLYEVEVLEGNTKIPILNPPRLNNIGPVCVGETIRYEAQDTVPITQYAITLDGDTITREHATNITWPESGIYELCLHQRNPCDVQLPECYEITVSDIPPVDTIVYLCPNACQDVFDSTLCEPGIYVYDYINVSECRASASVEVISYRNDTTFLFAQVCQGDTLFYQERSFSTTGRYNWLSSNIQGCDSLIYLDVEVDFCPLEIESTYQDILCHGDIDGQITVTIQTGLSPYGYTFRQLGGNIIANGTINGTTTTTFSSLLPGTYLLDVTDQVGNEGHLNVFLIQPDPLTVTVEKEEYLDFGVSCSGADNGQFTLIGSGGISPYRYHLDDTIISDTPVFGSLVAGNYNYKVEDANGCISEGLVELTEPEPLEGNFTIDDEICSGPGTGSAFNLGSQGGSGSYTEYLYQQQTNEPVAPPYENLEEGTYYLLVTDSNGCEYRDTFVIDAPLRATIDLQTDRNISPQGEERWVQVLTEYDNEIIWSPPFDTTCPNCPQITISPVEDIWIAARVVSPDGCRVQDSILVDVYPVFDVYLPSAFSPNGDGINDQLLIYGGPTVVSARLEVYDRWGAIVFSSKDGLREGWNGTIQERTATLGVYAYSVFVEYVGGRSKHFARDVILIK